MKNEDEKELEMLKPVGRARGMPGYSELATRRSSTSACRFIERILEENVHSWKHSWNLILFLQPSYVVKWYWVYILLLLLIKKKTHNNPHPQPNHTLLNEKKKFKS